MIHTVKLITVKAVIHTALAQSVKHMFFLELRCFLHDPINVGEL